jgi:hypothetical protein
MATLIDSPEYTANEIYEIQQTDPVEGAGTGASFSGIGVSNEPHQQLANRTSFLYGRQNTNIANIAALQTFVAGFTGSLRTAGYLKIPLTDVSRGSAIAIIQWGYYALAQQSIPNDMQFTATNVFFSTGGGNTAASVVSYNASGGTFVLDVPGVLMQRAGLVNEQSNGFSWLAIGF